jgi:hypothetical protein
MLASSLLDPQLGREHAPGRFTPNFDEWNWNST